MKTWTVEISVDETWIKDGFDLKAEKLEDAILSRLLPYAYGHEVKVKILS